jgi:acetyl esterase
MSDSLSDVPLSPAARRLLAELAGGPPVESLTVEEARAASRALVAAFAPPAAPVHRVEHVDAGGVAARLFTPAPADAAPIVVHVHGGGWVLGSVDEAASSASALAVASGMRVLSLEYRLAPEHPFPAALDDVMAALRWASTQADRVAVAGESAGGNLAAAAALRARDEGGPVLAFQLLIFPVVDARCASASYDEFAHGHLLTASAMRWFVDRYTDRPEDPYVSPLLAPDLTGLPPGLVVTAECDPLRDDGEAYAARLRDAGVDAVTSRYVGMVHGFDLFPIAFPDACAALREECGYALRDALGLGLIGSGP